ncbi:hypothetical protein [Sphingomonas sp. NBWT7]|uniref:hypothetical protein n=1 Tax=Sphingomonas sp. NBWT7 TaxID=2596913 RepID=UPI001628C957|nr:hypothetical protein [Sphingomonas sp. NBWT7]
MSTALFFFTTDWRDDGDGSDPTVDDDRFHRSSRCCTSPCDCAHREALFPPNVPEQKRVSSAVQSSTIGQIDNIRIDIHQIMP